MKKRFNNLLVFMLCMLLATSTYAQKTKKNSSVDVAAKPATMDSKTAKKYYKVDPKKFLQDWFLTIQAGTTTPFTDIRSYDWVRQTKKPSELQWNAGIGLTKMFNSAFGLSFDYSLGQILGRTVERGGFAEERQYWKQLFPERTEADGPIYFKTNIYHQASLSFYIDWLGLGSSYNKFIKSQITGKPIKNRKVALYTKLGVGLIRVSSQIYNSKDDKPIANSAYLRGYTNKYTETVFPFAVGMKFKLSKLFDLGVEGAFVFTNSDKLDAYNYSGTVKNNVVQGNSYSKINRDAFATLNVLFTYKFGRIGAQKEHVEWVNPLAFIMANQPKPEKDNLKDTDGDGILDILDKEPTTEAGFAVDAHGVTLDSDKDGCPDSKDPEPFSNPAITIVDCKNVVTPPTEPISTEPIVNNINNTKTPPYDGESINKRVEKVEDNLWKLTSVYYDLNKFAITNAASAELKKVGIVMASNPNLKVNVSGNTDTRGSAEYNQKLSENRVDAAIKYIIQNFGISADRFIKLPMGKSDPLVKEANSEGQHLVNRRVDFAPAK